MPHKIIGAGKLFGGSRFISDSNDPVNVVPLTEFKIEKPDFVGSNSFGLTTSISPNGNYLVIGDRTDTNAKGSLAGAAYIYERINYEWILRQKLIANNGGASNFFGSSVAISYDGSTVIVGAPFARSGKGSIYIYNKSGSVWLEEAELYDNTLLNNSTLGSSVSISHSGTVIGAGAPGFDNNKGSVIIFEKSASIWSQTYRRDGSTSPVQNGTYNMQLGYSISVAGDGNKIIAGKPYHDGFSGGWFTDSGGALVFSRQSPWGVTNVSFNQAANGKFGFSVSSSYDGSKILVGVPDVYDSGKGGVQILTSSNNYLPTGTGIFLPPTELVAGDKYGYAVCLSNDGNTALVTARNKSYLSQPYVGAAYIIDWNTLGYWEMREKILPFEAFTTPISRYFGESVSISENKSTFVVGNSGKGVYIYYR